MENASKALLMAASILLGLMIVTVGVGSRIFPHWEKRSDILLPSALTADCMPH